MPPIHTIWPVCISEVCKYWWPDLIWMFLIHQSVKAAGVRSCLLLIIRCVLYDIRETLTWYDDVTVSQNGELHHTQILSERRELWDTHHDRQLENTRFISSQIYIYIQLYLYVHSCRAVYILYSKSQLLDCLYHWTCELLSAKCNNKAWRYYKHQHHDFLWSCFETMWTAKFIITQYFCPWVILIRFITID